MVNAQDKALATLCIERGHLDDAAVERARLAHAEILERGEAPPLGNLLVQEGFLQPAIAAGLLRELALASFLCPRCERGWTYEELSQLTRYRCESCGERLIRKSKSTRSSVAPAPDATEVDRGRPRPTSGRASTAAGIRNSAVSLNVPDVPVGSRASGPMIRPSATGPVRPSATGPVRPSDRSAVAGVQQTAAGPSAATSPSAPPAAPTARTLGPYEILSELGRGAMGVVYLGRRPGLERLFAIKVLLGGALADAEAVERFRREAALASRVQHANVVAVYDVGVANGYYYYVMEHCPGRTLKQVLEQRGRFPGKEAAELVSKIARGVGAAHTLGVVHRDVKPANIMLEARSGNPRVADFGLARDASQGDTGMTRTGDLVGTPSYMAPEQLMGKRGTDARADVYALGIVLYELIAGVRPFLAETTAELAAKVLSEDARPLRSVVPDVALALDAIVAKAIEKPPERRYANAVELADDIDRFLAGEAVLARPERALRRVWRRSKKKIVAGFLATATLVTLLSLISVLHAREVAHERDNERMRHESELAREVAKSEADLRSLERDGLTGKELEPLQAAFQALSASAPATLQPAVRVTWAECLMRRARPAAAYEIAQTHVEAPGRVGLIARRIVADVLLDRGARGEAEPQLAALEAGSEPALSDWAKLRRLAALGGSVLVPKDLAERITRGSDSWDLRLLAELLMRDNQDKASGELLERALTVAVMERAASDEALAHLDVAILARSRRSSPIGGLFVTSDKTSKDEVALFFRLAGEEGASSPAALFERARTEFCSLRMSEVVRDLDAALDLGLDDPLALALRGKFPDARGRACAAKAKERGALDPPLEFSFNARYLLDTALGDDARAHLAKVAASAEEPARAALTSALLSSAAGESVADVVSAFAAARKAAPRCPVVARELARALVSRGATDRALEAIAAARDLPGAPLAELRLLEAEALLRRGLRTEAVELAKRVASSRQNETKNDAWGPLAECLVALVGNDAKSAVESATLALERSPENPTALRFLARAQDLADNKDAAMEAILQCLALEADLDSDNGLVLLTLETPPMAFNRNGGGGGGGGGGGRMERLLERVDTWTGFIDRFLTAEHLYLGAKSVMDQARVPRGDRGDRGDRRDRGGDLTRALIQIARTRLEAIPKVDFKSPLAEEGLGALALFVEHSPTSEALVHWRNALAIAPRWRLPPWLERDVKQEHPEVLDELASPR